MKTLLVALSLIGSLALSTSASAAGDVFECRAGDGEVTRGTLMVKQSGNTLLVWASGVRAPAAKFDFEKVEKNWAEHTRFFHRTQSEQIFFLESDDYYVRRVSTRERKDLPGVIRGISVQYVNKSYGNWTRFFSCEPAN